MVQQKHTTCWSRH